MSSTEENIRKAIEEISHRNDAQRTPYHFATVVEVLGDTCTVEAYGAKWTSARLTAAEGADFRVVPVVGSVVLVADLSNGQFSDLAVVMTSAVDRIELHGAKHTTANADVLREQLKILTDRVDTIYNALKNAEPGAQDGGAAYKAQIVSILESQTGKEDFSEIEDGTILH